ncbi:N-acetyl-gamma-glutamyl-phosphate/N-acetyl-gamma-aminoadipyl-phosphate reductase [Planctomycetes bacterium Poly30]|uniref:N-acetyl-gamma-glutamyl-phosphate reductase n=1 Tax=Saltatorellus ferox TaxID=2528018 RepID=A0A518EYM8_9BACT|nr:N-acetyl-gamma-glutamyl-phosphate/N-acetyl-gamma-aminoadipyl-phosphate reductase [Planctomycetes bacterium Poly30]
MTPSSTQRVSIVGGSGYVGGELLRYLIPHPSVEVVQVTSESNAGKPVRTLHPQLRGWSDLRFSAMAELEPCDLLILALPHGEAASRIDAFSALAPRIIDCSADFRLGDASVYESTYGAPHAAPDWLARFQYGLPEAHRGALTEAAHVSGVGCNATASNLALLPLARAGVLDPAMPAIVDLKVGSSEAGRRATAGSHHPERSGVARSFAPTGHRHVAEVRQVTGIRNVDLSVTSVEMVRGVLATAHVWLKEPLTDRALWSIYRESYGSDPFVRIVHDRGGAYRHPEPRLVAGTNHGDVGWELAADGRRLVALAAIDNLGKGAAGTAVQCLNLMAGFDEAAGLRSISLHPA